jgi:hypothetical protein
VALVAGCLCLIAAVGLAIPAIAVAAVDGAMRDDDGFLMTTDANVASGGYAVVSESLEIETEDATEGLPRALLGDVRIAVSSPRATPLFVGIAPAADVAAYLDGVAHSTVLGIGDAPRYFHFDGGEPPAPPASLDIWVAQDEGTGPLELTWGVERGDWTIVVMNLDGSRQVVADVSAGAEVPVLGWLVPVLFVAAGVAVILGLLLVGLSVHRATRVQAARP